MPGPTVVALRIGGPIEPWRDVGFAVDGDGRCQVGAVQLRLGGPGAGILGWTLTADGNGDRDGPVRVAGIPTGWRAPPPAAAPPHPNTAVSVDHVVLRTPDAPATFAALEAAGMVLRRERRAGDPGRQVHQGFFRHGEAIVEVVGPEPPSPSGAPSLWGLTVTVSDLDACAALLGPSLGSVRSAVQPGRRIATVDRAVGVGVPLAFMDKAMNSD